MCNSKATNKANTPIPGKAIDYLNTNPYSRHTKFINKYDVGIHIMYATFIYKVRFFVNIQINTCNGIKHNINTKPPHEKPI